MCFSFSFFLCLCYSYSYRCRRHKKKILKDSTDDLFIYMYIYVYIYKKKRKSALETLFHGIIFSQFVIAWVKYLQTFSRLVNSRKLKSCFQTRPGAYSHKERYHPSRQRAFTIRFVLKSPTVTRPRVLKSAHVLLKRTTKIQHRQ